MRHIKLIAPLLAAFATASTCTAGVIDDFSSPGTWANQSSDKVQATVENGVLVTNAPQGGSRVFNRDIEVPTAARWRAEVDITFRAAVPQNARAGLGFAGALGDQVQVALTSTGYVLITYFDGEKWAENDLMPFTDAKKAKAKLGAVEHLVVERVDGYFRVFVNDDYVGRTRVIDFTPRRIAILHQASNAPMTVAFDNLALSTTGQDSRYMRLLNVTPTPGSRVLVIDDFTRDAKGGPYPEWRLVDNDSYVARIENGEMVITGKKDNTDNWTPVALETLPVGLGYQLSARLRQVSGDGDYGKGISALGRKEDGDAGTPELSLLVSGGSFRVIHVDRKNETHVLIPWTKSPTVKPEGNHLTMAMENGKCLVFIDGEFQRAVDMPKGFELVQMGLAVTGPQTVAFDKVYAREF